MVRKILFFSFFYFSQAHGEKITVALDWMPNTNHSGLYVAQAQGWYKKEGLNVTFIQPTQTTTTQLVSAGRAEFGVSFMSDVFKARNRKIPVVTVAAIIQENTTCFAWRNSANISGIKDWEGKRYGGWGSPEEEATLKYLMKKNGADFSKLKIVTTGVSDFIPSTKKNADFMWIYMGWDGIRAKLAKVPFSILCPKDIDPAFNKPSPLIISSEKTIKSKSKMAKKFLAITQRGYEFAEKHPKETAAFLLKEVPELDKKLVEASAIFLANEYSKGAPYWGYNKVEPWKLVGHWMKEQKLIEHTDAPEKYFTNIFIEK